LKSVFTYFRERFPLPAVIVLAIGTAVFMVAVCSPGQPSSIRYTLTGLVALAFIAFLLRQRVMDEFKDRGHDNANYPNRPVQRGAVSIRTLVLLGLVSFLIEITSASLIAGISNNWQTLLCYLAVVAFSLLTAKEFFIPKWLNEHFTLYFITHQGIFVFFIIWAINIFQTIGSTRILAGSASFILIMASLEIMRKYEIRRNTVGEIVPDTYLAVWGERQANAVLASCVALAGLFLALFEGYNLLIIGIIAGLIIVGVRKSERAVQAATIGGFFALGLVAYFL
jgi:4-hydroxybenzoate polyprenyltransferase